jgi:hypothetical protein
MIGTMLVAAPANAATPTAHAVADDSSVVTTYTEAQMDQLYPGASMALSPANFARALTELEASEVPHTAIQDGELTFYQYTTSQGTITLPSAADYTASDVKATGVGSGIVKPQITLHSGSGGRWAIGLNSTDQSALGSGIVTIVTAPLCLIPGVGTVACIALEALIAIATAYVLAHGVCSKNHFLWVYDVKGGSAVGCRSTAPF